MKNLATLIFLFALVPLVYSQNVAKDSKKEPAAKKDNYTVQYLIVLNERGEVLLQKNNAGWHTLAMRSNENQSIKEALDSLAKAVGLIIDSIKLAGLYSYKFLGLADHNQISFRTHFTAKLKQGNLLQPKEPDKEYHWVPVDEAIEKITFESLKLETKQILKFPKQLWGGSFLIIWKGGEFIGSKVLEEPYPLRN